MSKYDKFTIWIIDIVGFNNFIFNYMILKQMPIKKFKNDHDWLSKKNSC